MKINCLLFILILLTSQFLYSSEPAPVISQVYIPADFLPQTPGLIPAIFHDPQWSHISPGYGEWVSDSSSLPIRHQRPFVAIFSNGFQSRLTIKRGMTFEQLTALICKTAHLLNIPGVQVAQKMLLHRSQNFPDIITYEWLEQISPEFQGISCHVIFLP